MQLLTWQAWQFFASGYTCKMHRKSVDTVNMCNRYMDAECSSYSDWLPFAFAGNSSVGLPPKDRSKRPVTIAHFLFGSLLDSVIPMNKAIELMWNNMAEK